MQRLQGSVGTGGVNLSEDVRAVQEQLNKFDLAPLKLLKVDGRSGPATNQAIRHFQTRFVGMSSPDGRVDPDGKTWKRLKNESPHKSSVQSPETRRADNEMRNKIVDPRVKQTEKTKVILTRLVPHLSKIRARVISGYLSDSDLFWKVNYHWEYLLNMVKHCETLPVEPGVKNELGQIRSSLLGCAPTPASGYTSGALGKPEDRSSMDDVTRRHKILSAAKRSFSNITQRYNLKSLSNKSGKAFDLAAAPVAHPGTSKHSTGYALDIEGDNSAIKNTCKSLGATLVFDEKSHVHVEFRNGVAA